MIEGGLYASLFDNRHIVMLAVDPTDGTIVDANPAAVEFYGWSRDELRSMKVTDINALAPADIQAEMQRAEQEKRRHFCFPHRLADGTERNVEVYSGPVLWGDRKLLLSVVLDVTERDSHIQSLASEALARRIMVEQSHDGIVVLEADGSVYEVNRAFAEMHGYSADEAKALHIWDWNHMLPPDSLVKLVQQTSTSGERTETVHTRRDGSTFDVDVVANASFVAGRKLVFCICRDVSERNRLERTRRERERFLDTVLATTREGFFSVSLDGVIQEANEAFAQMTGYSRAELEGMHLSQIDANEEAEDVARHVARIKSTGSEVFSAQHRRKDGALIDIEVSTTFVDVHGGRFVAFCRDVTERNAAARALAESEERLRTLSDNMPDGFIYRVDFGIDGSERRFLYVSAGVERLHGVSVDSILADPEVLYGQAHPDDRVRIAELEAEALATMSKFEAEVRFVTPDGSVRWGRFTSVPRRLENGHVVWDGVEVEVTARRQAEAELELHRARLEELVAERTRELDGANRELVAASQAKSAFLARMSHELRTPLNAIIGFSSLMLHGMGGTTEEEQHAKVEIIHSSAKHLLELINDVLEVTAAQSGGVRTTESEFDAAEVLVEVADELRASATEKGLRFVVQTPGSPVVVKGDRRRVRQILSNLVGNAIKFTADGFVDAILAEVDDDTVVFTVTDTGAGIPADDCARIFEPFAQVERAQSRSVAGGTGLGLAICREFAHMMGGSVSVESTVGAGSVFTLTLPRRPR